MRILYLLLLFPLLAQGQHIDDSEHGCQLGKIRYLGRIAENAKARMAYPGDASIDVTYYGLDLILTHTPNYLRGAATITLKSTVSELRSFFLDLNSATTTSGLGLHVDSIKTNSQKLTYQHSQNQLTVTLPQPLTSNQSLTLTVFYQGIPNNTGQSSFVFGKHENTADPAIWTLSEPYGASYWFPCRDSPADKADSSSVRITAPAHFVSVSNGTLVSTTTNPDGTRTYHWKNSYPIAQYLISIAMSNYEQYDTPFIYNGQTLPVTHYIYPETLPQVKANLDLTLAMLQYFTERFGPYPFLREKYGHAQYGLGYGGMEHQTISSMEVRAFTPAIIAHELAHQWFGDKITCRDWQNIWLNEGFASYAEAMYAEFSGGQTGYQNYMNNFMATARNARGSLYVQDISRIANIFSSSRSYAKGATVLHMLRGFLGDTVFSNVLRTYANDPNLAYKTAITEDFQHVAEQVSGKNLGYFFQQWVYGEGYPTYQATISSGSSSTSAVVRLEQRNTISTNPASFTMPVQIKVQSAVGDTVVTIINDQADQTFILPARGTVTGVVIDPNNWILKSVESTTIVTALTESSVNDLRIYPNPTAESLTLDFSLAISGNVTVRLTNQLGQTLYIVPEAKLPSGNHSQQIQLRSMAAGQYTLTIETEGAKLSRVVFIR